MSLAFYSQVVSQAPQKLRCSEKQATRQSIYSAISLHFGMSRAVHPQIQVDVDHKLQALVYDILPSTTAIFSYAIGSRKLSANEQFFVGAQTAVSLFQITRIK